MNEQDIMIEVNHMSHIYTDENGNDVRALDDVNLSIKRGEFAVSYTHLDVYKRQGQNCCCCC